MATRGARLCGCAGSRRGGQRVHWARPRPGQSGQHLDAVALYDVVRLLGEGDLDQVLGAVAERLRRELELRALAVELWQLNGAMTRFVAGDAQAIADLHGGAISAGRVLQAGRSVGADE